MEAPSENREARQGSINDSPEKGGPKRPVYNDFRQQRMKAWQPMLTPKSVLPVFFLLAVLFAPLGGVLLWASNLVQELTIDYSKCSVEAPVYPAFDKIPDDYHSASFSSSARVNGPYWQRNSSTSPTTCVLRFDIPNNIGPPVFIYYMMTNFYQNHRKYTKSLNIEQLKGEPVSVNILSGGDDDCDPETSVNVDCETNKPYYPAGAIANSIFNDTIYSPRRLTLSSEQVEYFMTNKGIAWQSDKELFKPTKYDRSEVVPPRNWRERYPDGYTEENPIPNLQEDEDFLVWMRTAALPNFSKLWRRNDTAVMVAGTYEVAIEDRFPVADYHGTKSILISTRTPLGGKNNFMGIAYLIVGSLCGLVGTLFTIAYTLRPRQVGDENYLSWMKNR